MTTMAAATPKPASDADGKVAEAGEEEKPASVRAAEAIAEAEMAAAEQAKALAAAQALALKAARAQAQAEKAAREAAEAEEAALREAQQDFPTISFAEQLRQAEEAKARERNEAERKAERMAGPHNTSAPLLGPAASSQFGWQAQQQTKRDERRSNTSDEDRPFRSDRPRADQVTSWRRSEEPAKEPAPRGLAFVPAPKPERVAWAATGRPPADGQQRSPPSQSPPQPASPLLTASPTAPAAWSRAEPQPPVMPMRVLSAGSGGADRGQAPAPASGRTAWQSDVSATSKPTLQQIQAQEEVRLLTPGPNHHPRPHPEPQPRSKHTSRRGSFCGAHPRTPSPWPRPGTPPDPLSPPSLLPGTWPPPARPLPAPLAPLAPHAPRAPLACSHFPDLP